MLTVFDSHWLPYRNAEIRAFALDNKTLPLDFYNITDSETDGDNIGKVVNTDERGFLHYGGGSGLQNVECLAVKESAIIQVSRPTGEILGQWALKLGQKALTADDLGTLTYADGTMAFNPAVPREWKLRDFALASDVRQGVWQEAQTIVVSSDTDTLKLDKWQSVIYIDSGFVGSALSLDASDLLDGNEPRFGIKFVILNGTDHDVTVRQAGTSSGSTAVIPAGHQICACALFVFNYNWYCHLAFDDTPAELQASINTLVAQNTEQDNKITVLQNRIAGLRIMPTIGASAIVTGEFVNLDNYRYYSLTIHNDPSTTPFVLIGLTRANLLNWTGQAWDSISGHRNIQIVWPAASGTTVQPWVIIDEAGLDNASDSYVNIDFNGIKIGQKDGVFKQSDLKYGAIFTVQTLAVGTDSATVITRISDNL